MISLDMGGGMVVRFAQLCEDHWKEHIVSRETNPFENPQVGVLREMKYMT